MSFFHFALPNTQAGRHPLNVAQAKEHIRRRFHITGAVEFVHTDPKFHLYRIEHDAT